MLKLLKSKSGIISFNQPLDDVHYYNKEELIGIHSFSESDNGQPSDFFSIEESDSVKSKHRALSKTTVSHNIDFAKGDVLKASTDMLKGVTLYPNHNMDVEKWVGTVENTLWSEQDAGIPVPGINAELSVDKKQAPAIARGLLMKSSPISSVSVTIGFDYERSHPKLTDRNFWMKFGEEVDGTIVRFIATKIKTYKELSFVYAGSDPYANRLNLSDAELFMFKDDIFKDKSMGNKAREIAKEWDTTTNKNYAEENFSKNSSIFITKKLNNQENGVNSMDREILCTSLGLKTDASDVEIQVALKAQATELANLTVETKSLQDQVKNMTTELETAKTENVELTKQLEESNDFAEVGKAQLETVRTNGIKIYKLGLAEGEEPNEELLLMINNGNLKSVTALTKSYKKAAEANLGHKINDEGVEIKSLQSSDGNANLGNTETKQVIVPGVTNLHS